MLLLLLVILLSPGSWRVRLRVRARVRGKRVFLIQQQWSLARSCLSWGYSSRPQSIQRHAARQSLDQFPKQGGASRESAAEFYSKYCGVPASRRNEALRTAAPDIRTRMISEEPRSTTHWHNRVTIVSRKRRFELGSASLRLILPLELVVGGTF